MAIASMNKNVMSILTHVKETKSSRIYPKGGLNWLFDNIYSMSRTNFKIGYIGAIPNSENGCWIEKIVNEPHGVFVTLNSSYNYYNPSVEFFVEFLDVDKKQLSIATMYTKGKINYYNVSALIGDSIRNELFIAPTGTKYVRYGFINSVDVITNVDTCPVMGFTVYALTDNARQQSVTPNNISERDVSATFNKNTTYAGSIPTTGKYSKGQIVYNTLPIGGDYVGWICITTGDFAGTPPVFKGFGLIQV